MANIVGSIVNGGSGSSSFTLTNGTSAGRALVVLATQDRNPTILAGTDFDFDGVAPDQVLGVATSGAARTLALIWEDSSLPASSGTYTLNSTAAISTRYSIYEMENADTSAVEVVFESLASGFADPVVVNFSTTDTNSVLFFVYRQNQNFGGNIGAGDSTDQTVDNVTFDYYIAHEVDVNGDAQMSIDSGVQTSDSAAYTAIAINSVSSTTTINNIDTDNAVNQYQQNAVISLTGFSETITNVTLNGVTCPIQSQSVGTSVTVDIPGSLATGSYDLVVSGASETDTLSGVSYTQTHEYTAPYGLVDSNSLFNGIVLTDNSYFRFVSDFTDGTLDKSGAESGDLWGNDVADIYTPDTGFTGNDSATLEILYDDGTTAQWTVTITVSEGEVVSEILSGNLRSYKQFIAGGATKGRSYNTAAIQFYRANGATSRQFNLAQKQYEDLL